MIVEHNGNPKFFDVTLDRTDLELLLGENILTIDINSDAFKDGLYLRSAEVDGQFIKVGETYVGYVAVEKTDDTDLLGKRLNRKVFDVLDKQKEGYMQIAQVRFLYKDGQNTAR